MSSNPDVSPNPDQASAGSMRGPVPPGPVLPGPVPPGPVPPGVVPPGPAPAGRRSGAPGQLPGTGRLKSAWKTGADGRTVFRLVPPLVLWWVWAAFVVINLVDLAFQSRDRFGLEVAAALLFASGVMYVSTVRPKVIADADGLTVINPFRDHTVPWSVVTGVYVGDSVEIGCERPAPKKPKTIYSWALHSPRRARARTEVRSRSGPNRQRYDARSRRRRFDVDPETFGRAPQQAKELASRHPSHIMAGELARRCEAAQSKGAQGGTLQGRWDWLGIAAVVLPAILLAVVIAR